MYSVNHCKTVHYIPGGVLHGLTSMVGSPTRRLKRGSLNSKPCTVPNAVLETHSVAVPAGTKLPKGMNANAKMRKSIFMRCVIMRRSSGMPTSALSARPYSMLSSVTIVQKAGSTKYGSGTVRSVKVKAPPVVREGSCRQSTRHAQCCHTHFNYVKLCMVSQAAGGANTYG